VIRFCSSGLGFRSPSAANAQIILQFLQPRIILITQRLNLTGESLEPSLIHCELSCILIMENTNLITEGLDSLVEVSEICRDGVGSALLSSVDFEDARGQRDKCCHGEHD
jgi:hypothetical protein